mmetsp:Transcript_20461/g.23622  ORF Transcript_20461/g.23622 Transcript_20461/m.23622 type:complete len:140 (-) Transcript_20461:28-447(-)
MKIGNLDYSNLTFEEALRIEPGNPQVINNYLLCLLIGKQFSKFIKMLSNVKKLISEKQYEKYRALHNKFMKVCGIHQNELFQKMKDNITNNMRSETSWNGDGDEDDENASPLNLAPGKSKFGKKKTLISISEESENIDA